jgi:hypothetical protein
MKKAALAAFFIMISHGLNSLARGQLTQYIMQNAAMAEVFDLFRGQQQYFGPEALDATIGCGSDHIGNFTGTVSETSDVEAFITVKSMAGGILTFQKLQRQYTHTDQIRSVDALEAFGDHGFNT